MPPALDAPHDGARGALSGAAYAEEGQRALGGAGGGVSPMASEDFVVRVGFLVLWTHATRKHFFDSGLYTWSIG